MTQDIKATAGLADTCALINNPALPTALLVRRQRQHFVIEDYDKILNSLDNDEVVLFADGVHPTHAERPVGCWAPKQDKLAIEQTSGRQRINIHGAINLEPI